MHDYNNMTAQQRTLRQALHACLWLAACLILLLTATAGAQPAEPSIQQLLIDRVTRIEAGETVTVADSEIASRILLPAIYRAHEYTDRKSVV